MCVAGEDERRGADGCGSDVGENLRCASATAAFGSAKTLLPLAANTGGDQGEQEDDHDRDQGGGADGQAEDNGESKSGESCSGGNGAHAPGKKGKHHGDTDGGEQVKDRNLPALNENHAHVLRNGPQQAGKRRASLPECAY